MLLWMNATVAMCQTQTVSPSSDTATVATATMRTMTHVIITRRRFSRSTMTPAGSWTSSAGNSPAKPTSPAALSDPVSHSTSRVNAMPEQRSAMTDMAEPVHSSRKSR